MVPTSKGKPAVASDGKLSFNTSFADFKRLLNLMTEPEFFQQYAGPMKFFDHPNNIFWLHTYSRSTFPNGYSTAKKKVQEIQAGITAAPADKDEPTASNNINDMFAVPSSALIPKKRSISPVDETPVEGHIKLETGAFIELAQDEEDFTPFTISTVFKGASQTYGLATGVVARFKENEEVNLSSFVATVEDCPSGECLCVYKECQSPITFQLKLKMPAIAQQQYSNKEDWGRAFLSFENAVAPYQRNNGDALYGFTQYVLPFKCLKTIKEDDLFSMFDYESGAFSFTVLLWHDNQSGRNAVCIKKAFNVVKPE